MYVIYITEQLEGPGVTTFQLIVQRFVLAPATKLALKHKKPAAIIGTLFKL